MTSDIYGMPDPASVERLTRAHLARSARQWPWDMVSDDSKLHFHLAVGIIKHYFGQGWVDRHISPEDSSPGYLRLNLHTDTPTTQETSYRVLDLGELLFNLQHVEGFDGCIRRMQQGDIEGAYAELDFGRMLRGNSIEFRYVKQSGVKGDDYDVEITLSDGRTLCADAKCKLTSTPFSEGTVRSTLTKARQQFPAGKPSAIFVKVPPEWTDQLDIRNGLAGVAARFLLRTGRIVSVKYYANGIAWRNGQLQTNHLFCEIQNPASRFGESGSWRLFGEGSDRGGGLKNWMPLMGLLSGR